MPELLTRAETPQSIASRVAGFNSEWWPTSNRNGGRLPLGIPGRLQSESASGGERLERGLHVGERLDAIELGWLPPSPDGIAMCQESGC